MFSHPHSSRNAERDGYSVKRDSIDYRFANGERILVIDDDKMLGMAVSSMLEAEGYRAIHVESAEEGVRQGLADEFDLVVTDLRLGKSSGIEVIRSLQNARADLPMILMTSYSSVDSAVEALRQGAVDYIIKPFNNDEFIYSVERALTERRMRKENALLRKSLKKVYSVKKIIGESAGIKRVLDLIRRVAPSDANVLIQGESGTGKELVAQAIHYESGRRDGPFVPVNCGAIPAELMESELFGHVKGAYTGATCGTEGLIREAQGGTLFLDEIAELPISMQVKLMRVLQEREVRPVGGKDVYRVDVRFLAASNKDLKKAIAKGEFREDVFYRLNVIDILVPPLRERDKDVEILAKYFIGIYSKKNGKRISGTSAEFSEFLIRHHWPGNVRELQNIIERTVILADSEILCCTNMADGSTTPRTPRAAAEHSDEPLSIEAYIRHMVMRYQATHSEVEIARMLGIGRKALWVRRRRWRLAGGTDCRSDNGT